MGHRIKIRSLLFVCAGVFFLTACQSRPPAATVVESKPVSLKTEPGEARVIVNPATYVVGADNSFEVKNIRTTTSSDQLNVQVEILNNRGRRDVLSYRIRWLNEQGMQVGQYDAWANEGFEGFQKSLLTFSAPRNVASDFRFEIKPKN